MPILKGLETYLAIKDVNPEISAVMMTAYGNEQDAAELAEKAVRENTYTCLYKPLDMEKLTALVEEIHRRQRLGALRKPSHGGNQYG